MRHAVFTLLFGLGLCAPAGATTGDDYRYAAVLPGDCERLVVADRDLTARCAAELVNVDFGDGRVTFMVAAESRPPERVVTAFTGGSSYQASVRSYVLDVDQLVTISGPEARAVEKPAIGRCTMTGDPLRERALFACWAESEDGRSRMEFRTRGPPSISFGNADS